MRAVSGGRMGRVLGSSSTARRDRVLVALTFVAGCVDGISYLGLDRVFTANMTGNAVLLGLALGQAQGLRVVHSAVALLGFVLGVGLGARLVDRGRERIVWSPRITRALVVELALLAALALAWWAWGPRPAGARLDSLIGLSAMAMGVQSATALRCAVSGVATTYITGTLTGLMAELAALGVAPANWVRSTSVLVALVAGASVGALMQARVPVAAPFVPALLLAAIVVVALGVHVDAEAAA